MEYASFKIEMWLGIIVSTLFSIILWARSRENAKKAGERTESSNSTFIRQLLWAFIFVFVGCFLYFAFNELHGTGIFITAGITMLIWGLVAKLFETRRPQAPTYRRHG